MVAASEITYGMYTMCMVKDGDRVLLMNRPDSKGFPGYLAPGGKIEFPESLTEGAIREVYEETGLRVSGLIYKGLDEYVVPLTNFRYMVFNYLATSYEGKLLDNPPEGELIWVPTQEVMDLPMQSWFKRKFPLFFKEGTFEISVVWNEEEKQPIEEKIALLI
ncbi:8-oxo-dGTP diphosphatase [Paenibacillus alvei]|uniref:8-oxo-dGTP diphosphatase n=1 Tax=Paenibacillus alvei TaxID=44250 RepID=UPI000289E503|nr:8-oxo-dGTP diphosphatase [Paenibacillus alvei]EJW16292.1 hydrolase, NUDIX family [Paenibacillus alvei DSM 29]MCY9543244.1 8-oxo-dGTP diphosphatase [Paenibacillus alvei]MCY9704380.1 8-oxo-dGTP diphosphatase [Paenibacillus alvei]MCY9737369.1 8-oxo-dGTP diphosphatase [Paenibacillus alvei]MCY9757071.1 8-oxo-dGTP diphosphatase [Paenibacillus alvei]